MESSVRYHFILYLIPLFLSLGLSGCKDQEEDVEESGSLILGLDDYYADPTYNRFTGPASGRDRVLARVNGEAIRREQLDEGLVGIVDLRRGEGLSLEPQAMDEVRARLLDSLITLTVERQEALRTKLEVSEEDVDKFIREFQERQHGEERLNQELEKAGISQEEFRRLCEREVRVKKLRDKILAEPVPEPTKEEIQGYYQARWEKWAFVHAASIYIKAPLDLPPIERQKKRDLAAEIRRQAMQGADFARLAREFSDDERSRAAGGDMGWYPLSGLDPEIQSVMKELPVGAISDVVEVTTRPGLEGFSFFKMLEYKRLTPDDDEKVRIAVIEEWKNRKRQETYQDWLVRRRNDSRVVILDSKTREILGI